MIIFLVEDDPTIQDMLTKELEKWSYQVYSVKDFSQVFEEYKAIQPDLVLLDITLPHYNGYYWCEKIRNVSKVPIIFISARTEQMDIVMAMQMGADDYIEKPIRLHILIAKVQAILRRTYDYSAALSTTSFGPVSLATHQAQLNYRGHQIDLTKTELQILQELFIAQGQFVDRESLIEACWQAEHFIDDNTLAVNISRLRKKLKTIGLDNFIQTKKNIGYQLVKGD